MATFTYDGSGERSKMEIKRYNNSQILRYYLNGSHEVDVTPAGEKERLYLGGDAYSAPSVLVKENGSWNIYYICRDHLGSITQITNGSGVMQQELSYDAWGRLRNPSTLAVYAPDTEPTLFLGRGYTGHEHLTMFGLVNMNARLYDPAVGRFLSPDPYVQMADFSQSYNRFSYALNNPFSYVDPDGENPLFIGLAILGAYIGGVASNNGELNPIQWNYSSVSTYFGIGLGAITGYFGAYGIVHPGSMIFAGSASTPWMTIGASVTSTGVALGDATDWKYNFNWSTAAGGGGGITNSDNTNSYRNIDKSIQNARDSWNYSAYAYASSSLLLLSDDVTGIGVANDVLIPIAYGGATIAFAYDNSALIAKQAREIEGIAKRALSNKQGFVYQLQATVDGEYKNVRGGTVHLNAGDVWKYGQTVNGAKRYSQAYLEEKKLRMQPIYWGNQMEILIHEKYMIYGYTIKYGTLPPGNKIFR